MPAAAIPTDGAAGAGAIGFTFHIDSEQNRPQYKGQSEIELCDLRLQFARMVNEVGGLFVSFGMTIYPGNIDKVPEVVRWANQHIDLVHGLVFITLRAVPGDASFNYFVDGQIVQPEISYMAESDEESQITSRDVYAAIQAAHPHYETSSYLGGTATHDRQAGGDSRQGTPEPKRTPSEHRTLQTGSRAGAGTDWGGLPL